MTERSRSGSRSATGVPPTVTAPAVVSMSRGISETSVDFPDPVDPTMAVVVPGRQVKVRLVRTGSSAPG